MKEQSIFTAIGQLTLSFSKIEFLLANISIELRLVKDYEKFYESTSLKIKIKHLLTRLKQVLQSSPLYYDLRMLVHTLFELTNKKNAILQSVILNHDDEYVFHRFEKSKFQIKFRREHYNLHDMQQLNQRLIKLHNELYILWNQMTEDKRVFKLLKSSPK